MIDTAKSLRSDEPAALAEEIQLPVVRVPMLDREQQLLAYELRLQPGSLADDIAMHRLMSTIIDGSINQFTRGNLAFVRLAPELVFNQAEFLRRKSSIGLVIHPHEADDELFLECLQQLVQSGSTVLLDFPGQLPPALPGGRVDKLISLARFARLDTRQDDTQLLAEYCKQLHGCGLQVVAGHVHEHLTYRHCLELPFAAVQGRYLLTPEKVAVPTLSPNRLSVLRLLRALQEEKAGPVELGQIIRNDALLSYKLLACVNSAYFALPCRIKSVEQAAIFFGMSRMRNWIATLTLSGMSDRPPELLRAALIRAQMCEQLAQGLSQTQREMAFTTGLFSLLDSLMGVSMDFVLKHVPLDPAIGEALLAGQGPFAPLLEQVLRWEAGKMRGGMGIQPQQIQRMATAYFHATRWADHVYTFAERQAATD